MKTRKRSYAARLGILAVALALTSTCLLGGTMAKYATEVTGTGSATVAAWSFKVNGKDSAIETVDLASTAYSNVKSKTIAPGTKGSFTVEVDATGSDVAVKYTIKFSDMTNVPTDLKFYSDEALTKPIDPASSPVEGAITADAQNKKVATTIYWSWPYTTGTDDAAIKANDKTDTGDAGKTVSFKIAVTGTQVLPEASPTS